jgi:hypothetical protein
MTTVEDTPLQQPPYVPGIAVLPTCAPERMDHHDRSRFRAGAFKATKVYPGPVGELICSELMAWDEWGFRLGAKRKVMMLLEHIEQAIVPVPGPSAPDQAA